MKDGWKEKAIGEILQLEYGKPLDEANRKPDGLYPVYGANGEKDRSDKFYFDKPSIVVGRKGSAGEVNLTEPKFWPLDVTYFVTFDDRQYDLRFIFYLLITLELPRLAKGVKPGINRNEVYAQVVKIPPLLEQRRIVGILDDALDGIATAKANAEKNLQNARALFESHLHGVDAEKALLGDLVKITTGKLDANAAVEGGQYPFFTCSREIYTIDKYAFECEAILLAGNNAVGDFNVKHYKGKFNAYQRTYVITVNEKKRVLYRFLYFQLLKSLKKFKAQSVGTGTKFLKLGMIKDLEIALPSLTEQQQIVSTIDSIREETERLESIYRQKLAALDALKESLLHQAFSGELTEQSQRSVVIPSPIKIPNITTTDLHAGILAIAFQLHEKKGYLKYFGHVKAEKIAHMVEAHVGIDLGRIPVKDAAGPNDFPHLKRVEHRARMAKFFDFRRVEETGYRVKKCRRFEELIERTREKLGDRSREVDRLLELMLPMDTQEAELT